MTSVPDSDAPAPRWDRDALRAGAGVVLICTIPCSVGASWAGDRDDAILSVLFNVGAVLGFVLGGGCAAWAQRLGLPLQHALVAAMGTYLAAQAVFIAIAIVRGNEINWFAALFGFTVVVCAGLVGGWLGGSLRSRGLVPSSERPR